MPRSHAGSNFDQRTGRCATLSQIVFDEFSTDGHMTVKQLKRMCSQKGFECDEEELDAAFVRLDTDETGFIEYPEFQQWWKQQDECGDRLEALRYQSSEEKQQVTQARASFVAITGGLGFMTREQFQLRCYSEGYCLSDWELDEAMDQLDKDGNGTVEFAEYLRWRLKDDRFAHLQHDEEEDEQAAYVHKVCEFFRTYDTDLKGTLSVEQFRPLYESMVEAEEVTATLEQCVADVDNNGDGLISLNEFLKWYSGAE